MPSGVSHRRGRGQARRHASLPMADALARALSRAVCLSRLLRLMGDLARRDLANNVIAVIPASAIPELENARFLAFGSEGGLLLAPTNEVKINNAELHYSAILLTALINAAVGKRQTAINVLRDALAYARKKHWKKIATLFRGALEGLETARETSPRLAGHASDIAIGIEECDDDMCASSTRLIMYISGNRSGSRLNAEVIAVEVRGFEIRPMGVYVNGHVTVTAMQDLPSGRLEHFNKRLARLARIVEKAEPLACSVLHSIKEIKLGG